MAGLATSASISSFITWGTCSGHRSLNGIRTLATYAGTRKSNTPNRSLLNRTATVSGPSPISRVRFSISLVSSSAPLTLKPPPVGNQRHFHTSTPVSAPRDPYQALGVKKDATAAEIKKTYFSVRLESLVLSLSRAACLTRRTARS